MKQTASDWLWRSLVLGCGAALCTVPVVKAADEDSGLILSTKGGIKVESADGKFKSQFGGRLMIDGAYYDDDVTQLGSGAEIRRARLFAEGTVWDVWGFKSQIDFAGNEVDIKDAYITYGGWDPVSIKLGNFKEYFSLEELTSSKYITFMERALPVEAFAPSRNLGIGAHAHGAFWQGGVGFFGEGIDSGGDETSSGYGIAGRLTFAPSGWNGDGRVLHFGGSVEYREEEDEEIRFRSRPESHVTDIRLVDTADFDAEDTLRWGVEAAGVWGPWSVQGEYMQADVNRVDGDDPTFSGWYAYGSWFLTGESRNYDPEDGTFGRVKPAHPLTNGGLGAWELGVRYSTLDLEDAGILGGDEDNITVGLNWYATSHLRFMANYIYVKADPNAEDLGGVKDEPQVFQVRAQIDF
jgi:phosphate-selective porin OprO/OprP